VHEPWAAQSTHAGGYPGTSQSLAHRSLSPGPHSLKTQQSMPLSLDIETVDAQARAALRHATGVAGSILQLLSASTRNPETTWHPGDSAQASADKLEQFRVGSCASLHPVEAWLIESNIAATKRPDTANHHTRSWAHTPPPNAGARYNIPGCGT
jgi:hypothetical protein